jgi:hypothetical protein
MRKVVDAPLRPQDDNDIAAFGNLTRIKHNTVRRAHDAGAHLAEYVYAFVNAGATPGLEPEGLLIPIVPGRTRDGNRHSFRDKESNREYRDNRKQNFL